MDEQAKAKLERLKAIRAGHRGVVTKAIKECDEILGTTPISEENVSRLEILDQQLRSKLSTLKDLGQEFLAICDVKDIEQAIMESEEIEFKLIDKTKRIEATLSSRQPQNTNEASTTATSDVPQENTIATNAQEIPSSTPNGNVSARLPKLILPNFKGETTKWQSFWDSFKSAVHENTTLSPVEKFNYLISLLEGTASRTIQGLTLTEANYHSAIELLKERFGQPQQIISAHMDELLKIQGCNDSDRFTSLRYVYDKITVHVRGLASLGVDSEQYGSLLIPIVMAKLPSELRLRIARVAKGSVWKIDELLDVIRQEVEAKEISERVRATDQKPSTYHRNRPSTASALFSKAELNDKGSSLIKCVYCEAPHYSASCAKVTDTKLRRNILFESKRCFKCLKPGHQVKNCRKPNGCRSCGGHHHQSICSNASLGSKRETNDEESNKQERDIEEKPATRTTCAKTKENVLLQTATATALNEDGSKSTTVRILFDTGSQRSYITDNLKTRLGLKPTKTETLQLNTFGEKGYRKQRCDVAAVRLKTNARELLEISALSYPVICSPLPGKVNVKEYSHLHGLRLADSSIENQPIDVLIGSDYYWEFIEGETIRGHAGPTAVNSKFGWLLSGPVKKTTNCTSSKVVSNLVVSGFNAVPHDIVPENDEMLNYTLKRFWETEAIGIKESTTDINPSITPECTKPKISHNGRYYEASLPWKDDCMPTSNNYGLCVSRLRYLYYNLKKKPALLKEYDGIIREQCKAGIIERVPNEVSKEPEVKGVHFSPHHAVVRTSRETTKVRVVYDGSAKSTKDDRSLNDCLHMAQTIFHLYLIR